MSVPTTDAAAGNRASRRVTPAEIGASSEAQLLPGGDVEVINLSNTGMLVEGKTRLAIGGTVSIRFQSAAIRRFAGTIVRSMVSTIHRDGTLSYETAVEFDRPYPVTGSVTLDDERALSGAEAPPTGTGTTTAEDVYVLDAENNDWT